MERRSSPSRSLRDWAVKRVRGRELGSVETTGLGIGRALPNKAFRANDALKRKGLLGLVERGWAARSAVTRDDDHVPQSRGGRSCVPGPPETRWASWSRRDCAER